MQDVLRRLRALDADRRATVLARLAEHGEEFDVHPVSAGERRLWLLDQLHPETPAYNVPYAFRLRGELDAGALGAALATLGRRHEALRTVFLDIGGAPRQMVLPEPQFELVVEQCPAPEPERDAAATAAADRDARQPFDLSTGPLVRARLLRFDSDDAVLLVCLHHIVCDGWSTKLLFDEWRLAYEAAVAGREPDLGPQPLQYVDFTRWQAAWLTGEVSERLRQYWVGELAGVPPMLELPTDRPRPPHQQLRGTVERFDWPAQLAGRLASFCHNEQVTPFMVLLAAWNLLLHRYSGEDDIVVGSGTAGRNRLETERAIGFYANTIAIRCTVDPDAPFRSLLAQVRASTLAAQANQDLPFESVVDALRLPRSTAHHPLFQTLVVMQESEHDIFRLPGVDVGRVISHSGTAKWDLQLAVTSIGDGIGGWLEYDTALYDRDTTRRLLGHLRELLTAGLETPDRPVGQLPMLTEAERDQLVRTPNPATPPPRTGPLVHELLEAGADAHPDRVTARFGDDRITYRELDERANRLATHLRSLGALPDTLVGICLPRSIELLVAMFGVLKSGAAYVPLDPEYPPDRLAYMIADSGARLVVTLSSAAAGLPSGTPTVLLDAHAAAIAARPAARPQRVNAVDDLAYVIYTSGSTGRPKAAMIPHRGVCNLAAEQVRVFGTGPDDRVLQFASFSFDASVLEIMLGLHAGGCVVLATRSDLQPGPDLARTIREQGVTTTFLPPTVLRLMRPADVPGLTTLVVGGEICPEEFALAWAPGHRFFNIYGPTEATIWATFARCAGTERPLPIGRPINGVRCYVLDRNLEPVPVGVPGELCLGGPGVGRGYLGRPELTAKTYVPDPFGGQPGARLYRSGDLARFRPDGQLEFLRRIDGQVKVRGYRIELGEIQSTLARHPSVRAAVVTTHEGAPGDVRLVAYLVAAPGAVLDPARLRAALRTSLPEHMVPAAFVEVPGIPRTSNGKLDYRALPAPEFASDEASVAPPTAGTELERKIVGVWREVLRVDRIGTADNFFDLGGNSILLAQVRSRLADVLGREVRAITLMTYPTVRALAEHFEDAEHFGDAARPAAVGVHRSGADRAALLARSARLADADGGSRR